MLFSTVVAFVYFRLMLVHCFQELCWSHVLCQSYYLDERIGLHGDLITETGSLSGLASEPSTREAKASL